MYKRIKEFIKRRGLAVFMALVLCLTGMPSNTLAVSENNGGAGYVDEINSGEDMDEDTNEADKGEGDTADQEDEDAASEEAEAAPEFILSEEVVMIEAQGLQIGITVEAKEGGILPEDTKAYASEVAVLDEDGTPLITEDGAAEETAEKTAAIVDDQATVVTVSGETDQQLIPSMIQEKKRDITVDELKDMVFQEDLCYDAVLALPMDITLTAVSQNTGEETEIQPNGPVTVSMELPTTFMKGTVSIYHMEEDGSLTRMEGETIGNSYTFQTEHFSTYVLLTESATVLERSTTGKTLTNGIYAVTSDTTISNTTGGSGITISGTVTIYVKGGCTLSVTGGSGSSRTAAGAGILLTSGNTLYLCGQGTVAASGGNAGNGSGGSTGGRATFEYIASSGSGGSGGGGAGAGIGTSGGSGGTNGANIGNEKTGGEGYPGWPRSLNTTPGSSNNGSNGSGTNTMGTLYILDNLVVRATGGSAGSNGSGGSGGSSYYNNSGGYNRSQGGSGGGGGGGGGAMAANIGSGGAGGGGGGGGSTGGSFASKSAAYAVCGVGGNGGGGGSGGGTAGAAGTYSGNGVAASSNSGTTYSGGASSTRASRSGSADVDTIYSGYPGRGGTAGAAGGGGVVYKTSTSSVPNGVGGSTSYANFGRGATISTLSNASLTVNLYQNTKSHTVTISDSSTKMEAGNVVASLTSSSSSFVFDNGSLKTYSYYYIWVDGMYSGQSISYTTSLGSKTVTLYELVLEKDEFIETIYVNNEEVASGYSIWFGTNTKVRLSALVGMYTPERPNTWIAFMDEEMIDSNSGIYDAGTRMASYEYTTKSNNVIFTATAIDGYMTWDSLTIKGAEFAGPYDVTIDTRLDGTPKRMEPIQTVALRREDGTTAYVLTPNEEETSFTARVPYDEDSTYHLYIGDKDTGNRIKVSGAVAAMTQNYYTAEVTVTKDGQPYDGLDISLYQNSTRKYTLNGPDENGVYFAILPKESTAAANLYAIYLDGQDTGKTLNIGTVNSQTVSCFSISYQGGEDDSDYGLAPETESYFSGTQIKLAGRGGLAKDDSGTIYYFSGWKKVGDNQDYAAGDSYTVANTAVFTAQWKSAAESQARWIYKDDPATVYYGTLDEAMEALEQVEGGINVYLQKDAILPRELRIGSGESFTVEDEATLYVPNATNIINNGILKNNATIQRRAGATSGAIINNGEMENASYSEFKLNIENETGIFRNGIINSGYTLSGGVLGGVITNNGTIQGTEDARFSLEPYVTVTYSNGNYVYTQTPPVLTNNGKITEGDLNGTITNNAIANQVTVQGSGAQIINNHADARVTMLDQSNQFVFGTITKETAAVAVQGSSYDNRTPIVITKNITTAELDEVFGGTAIIFNNDPFTIMLLADIIAQTPIVFDADMTLDLNGHTLSGQDAEAIHIQDKKLAITDNCGGQAGAITGGNGKEAIAITSPGTLVLDENINIAGGAEATYSITGDGDVIIGTAGVDEDKIDIKGTIYYRVKYQLSGIKLSDDTVQTDLVEKDTATGAVDLEFEVILGRIYEMPEEILVTIGNTEITLPDDNDLEMSYVKSVGDKAGDLHIDISEITGPVIIKATAKLLDINQVIAVTNFNELKEALENGFTSINIDGDVEITSDLIVREDVTVNVTPGHTVTVDDTYTWINEGTIILSGEDGGNPAGKIVNNGVLDNTGTIKGEGQIKNNSIIDNEGGTLGEEKPHTLTIDNQNGKIENGTGGTFKESNQITGGEITGDTTNEGSLKNCDIIADSFVNDGTLEIDLNHTLVITGEITNNGTIDNQGTIQINDDAVVINNGIIENNGTLDVKEGGTLDNDGTITGTGEIKGTGEIDNQSGTIHGGDQSGNGKITIASESTITGGDLDGAVTNNGTLEDTHITPDSIITNNGVMEGDTDNDGTINNTSTGEIKGKVDNDNGIVNGGTIATGAELDGGTLTGDITNEGTIKDSTIDENGTITGGDFGGDIINNGTIENADHLGDGTGTVVNNGTIETETGEETNIIGQLDNNGTIINDGKLIISGELNNGVDDDGTIENTGELYLKNDAVINNGTNQGEGVINNGNGIDQGGVIRFEQNQDTKDDNHAQINNGANGEINNIGGSTGSEGSIFILGPEGIINNNGGKLNHNDNAIVTAGDPESQILGLDENNSLGEVITSTVHNEAELRAAIAAGITEITIDAIIDLSGDFQIEPGVEISIKEGSGLNGNGNTIYNNGIIKNYGEISGDLVNEGIIDNGTNGQIGGGTPATTVTGDGRINGGVIANDVRIEGGTLSGTEENPLHNHGTIADPNEITGKVINESDGIIEINSNKELLISGELSNLGLVDNDGSIISDGNGVIINKGVIDNDKGILGDDQNKLYIDNTNGLISGGTFEKEAVIRGGFLEGEIKNKGTVDGVTMIGGNKIDEKIVSTAGILTFDADPDETYFIMIDGKYLVIQGQDIAYSADYSKMLSEDDPDRNAEYDINGGTPTGVSFNNPFAMSMEVSIGSVPAGTYYILGDDGSEVEKTLLTTGSLDFTAEEGKTYQIIQREEIEVTVDENGNPLNADEYFIITNVSYMELSGLTYMEPTGINGKYAQLTSENRTFYNELSNGTMISNNGSGTETVTITNLPPGTYAIYKVTKLINDNGKMLYKAEFDTLGKGSAPEVQYGLEEGSRVSVPKIPVTQGYIFDGWYSDVAYQNVWNFSMNGVYGNVTLFARWETAPGGGSSGGSDGSGGGTLDKEDKDKTEEDDNSDGKSSANRSPIIVFTKDIYVGHTFRLTLSNSKKAVVKVINTNSSIASASKTGAIKGKKAGKTTITYQITQNGATYCFKIKVTVKKGSFANYSLSKSYTDLGKYPVLSFYKCLKKGKTTKIAFEGVGKDTKITYRSNNPFVATVSRKGTIKGVRKGFATITVTTKQNKKTYKYRVVVRVDDGTKNNSISKYLK